MTETGPVDPGEVREPDLEQPLVQEDPDVPAEPDEGDVNPHEEEESKDDAGA
jgi:hypothetical protein